MEQSDLRGWEYRCIQEENPECMAACPLHVDARALCTHAAAGKWNEAWAVLVRTMPLPGVLARICDAPCRDACLRGRAGGAIEVGRLERVVAEMATKSPRIMPLRKNGRTALVVGGGLAGLTAASDLARKGFEVTLASARPGGALLDVSAEVLPPDVLAAELDGLRKLGVRFVDEDRSGQAALDAVADFGAVFVDPEQCPAETLGCGEPDDISLGTQTPGLFAGPASLGADASPVFRAALGRRAASSIERFTQGASLTANREKEGPYPTRLVTNIAEIESAAPVEPAGAHYDADEAVREAARCLRCDCMECVKHCAYLEHFGAYPKVYARRIFNNASIVMGTRMANTMINSCMLCGLCETICPNDFAMQDLALEARRDLVKQDNMPPSAHEFALRDMAFASGEKTALTRHAPGQAASTHVFFPGCQLTASDPDAVDRVYAALRERVPQTGLMLRCCGAPAHWSGREELCAQHVMALRGEWESLGKPVVVAACPSCMKLFGEFLPEAEVRSLWSILREHGLPEREKGGAPALALHDPCTSRHDEMLQDDARAMLRDMGVAFVEPRLTGPLTECCGYGGLLSEANPPLADVVAERRVATRDEDFVTYCAMCRDRLSRTGKRIVHILDLLLPPGGDPAARPAPGYSERRENRARLKDRLLAGLWNESGPQAEDFEAVHVEFTEEAAQKMEDRRILVSDVQKVLLHGERTRRKLVQTKTGRFLAAFRPVAVTYWVEYEHLEPMEPTESGGSGGGGYRVHNVWHHRMQVMGGMA